MSEKQLVVTVTKTLDGGTVDVRMRFADGLGLVGQAVASAAVVITVAEKVHLLLAECITTEDREMISGILARSIEAAKEFTQEKPQ